MDTKSSTITIADLCEQYRSGSLIINRSYQRTAKVWPTAAKSYLIDTILNGYPVPKLAFYQKIDLAKRKTIREIVDGQQRTMAILDFYNDKLRLSSVTRFRGKVFSQLEESDQRNFLEYGLSVDVFVGATENDIRQVFRRMNSYTVPLNPEEKRHAVYQGLFKWFIVSLIEKYSEPLKQMGVITESNISRMQDAKLFSEIIYTIINGIDHAQDSKLDKLYSDFDEAFPLESVIQSNIDWVMMWIISCRDIHNTELMKPYIFYSLFTALYHCKYNVEILNKVYSLGGKTLVVDDTFRDKLLNLNEALIAHTPHNSDEGRFIENSDKATNRKSQREERFSFFCKIATV